MKYKVLITGASRGIGHAIKNALSDDYNDIFTPTRGDLELSCRESVKSFIQSNHSFDIIINCAGINLLSPFTDFSLNNWDQMLQVNLTTPMTLIKSNLPHMRRNNYGRIVNITSIFSTVTKAERSLYSATKAALKQITKTIAIEEATYGITANSISPGYISTELTVQNNSLEDLNKIASTIPIQRLGQAEEIADFVKYIVSPSNTYATGQDFIIDGGFTSL